MITKNFLLTFFVTLSPIVALAQLKVESNGNVFIGRDSLTGQSSLSVGTLPGMTSHSYDSWRMGLRAYAYNTEMTGHVVGVFAESAQQFQPAYCFSAGVWGVGGNAFAGMSYGVMGSLHTGSTGAAIYGSNCDNGIFDLGSSCLAGYFYGPVHVVGGVYATAGFSSPSDMRLKREVVSVRDSEAANGSTLENLSGLEVLSYKLELPRRRRLAEDGGAGINAKEDPNEKCSHLRHYGVSAEELQKVFPDLVSEDANGYLSVNYVEIVPLLIRSLQELRQEIAELRGDGSAAVKKTSRQTASFDNPSAIGGAALLQNSPNPFSERTIIRFTLPDDARQAYIYIFDMAGKMLRQMPVDGTMQSVTINGYELSPGMYIYSLVVNGQEMDTKKMILSSK